MRDQETELTREDAEKAHKEILKLNISPWLPCDAGDAIRIGRRVCSASLFEFGYEDPITYDNAHISFKTIPEIVVV